MKKIDKLSNQESNVNKIISLKAQRIGLEGEHNEVQSLIDGVKSQISSLSSQRSFAPIESKKKNSKGPDLMRAFKKFVSDLFKNFVKTISQNKNISKIEKKEMKVELKEVKKDYKAILDENQNVQKIHLNIFKRSMETKFHQLDNMLTESAKEINDLEPSVEPGKDSKLNEDLFLSSNHVFQLNSLSNSVISVINQTDPFSDLNDLSEGNKEFIAEKTTKMKADLKAIMLEINPDLANDIEKIDEEALQSPDPDQAFMDFSVVMLPLDMANQIVDIFDMKKDGYEDLAKTETALLQEDMKDFYKYLAIVASSSSR